MSRTKREVNCMNLDSKTFIDTNILVYSINKDSSKYEIAKRLLIEHCKNGTAFLSAQNLAEFSFVVTEKDKLISPGEASQIVQSFIETMTVVAYHEGDVLRANQIKQSYGVPFYDALLVAVMEKAKIFTIVTNNERDFKKVNWLEVVNPFRG